MNSYELSRYFCEWAFNNPEKIKPIHYAIYYFSIEHCNRLGWKDKFGLPSQMVMEAIGVKNWRTYSSGLNDLVEFGFIKMIEVSKNQYSSNIIAIVKNTKARTKALDKALSKHDTKHSQGTVSIDKQETINKEQLTITETIVSVLSNKELDFDLWWNKYDKKQGKEKALAKWMKLKDSEIQTCLEAVDAYVVSTPDKQFRKLPITYLNGCHWNDEISINNQFNKLQNNEQLREITTEARIRFPQI